MSTSLFCVPHIKREGRELSFTLKRAVACEFLGHDGSLTSERAVIGASAIPFFRGLLAGGNKNAADVIELIEKHGEIEIWTA